MQITLTTTGRRSGTPRRVTLFAWEDGDDLVVVGSKGGFPVDPFWVANLRADPRGTVGRGNQTDLIKAREVDGAERDRLWKLVVDRFPLYATYQTRAKRTIPILVLETIPSS